MPALSSGGLRHLAVAKIGFEMGLFFIGISPQSGVLSPFEKSLTAILLVLKWVCFAFFCFATEATEITEAEAGISLCSTSAVSRFSDETPAASACGPGPCCGNLAVRLPASAALCDPPKART